MKKSVSRIIAALLLPAFALMLAGCGTALKEAARLSEYEIGGESIPSITSLVGEREVTGVEASTNNGIASKQYTYVSSSVYDDLLAYVKLLMENGWLVTKDIDLNVVPGSGELGRKASEEGQILMVSFSYEEGKYAIKVTKGKGTIE